jgi:hypothetical protein
MLLSLRRTQSPNGLRVKFGAFVLRINYISLTNFKAIIILFYAILFLLFSSDIAICMELDPI